MTIKCNLKDSQFFNLGNCHDCNAPAAVFQIPGDMVVVHAAMGCAGFRARFTPTPERPTVSRGLDEKGFDSHAGNVLDTKNPLGNLGVATASAKHLGLAREIAGSAGAPNMTEGQVLRMADRLAASEETPGEQAPISEPDLGNINDQTGSDAHPNTDDKPANFQACPVCGQDLPAEMKA